MLCKVRPIIMTVAIDAHYLPLVDFYALALLASRSTRWVRLRFVLHNTHDFLKFAVILALFLLAVPLASCSGRSVRLCFVLCNVGSIIMTVAINALYLPFVDFYAPALLASRFFCVYCARLCWLCKVGEATLRAAQRRPLLNVRGHYRALPSGGDFGFMAGRSVENRLAFACAP